MKKSLSIFLCVVSVLVFCAFPFGMAVYADVVSSTVDFSKDVIQNYTLVGVINNYYNTTQKKVEAARSYYFYMICNDTLSSGCTIFDDSGTRFSDDILNFYYEQYHLACSGTDAYYSDGDIYLSAAGFPDVPFSLRLLSFSNWPLTSSDSQDFKNYYNSFLARYLLAQGQSASDPNPGKSGLDIAPGYVTSEELVDGIEKDNSYYTPKGELIKISYRTDEMFQTWTNFPSTPRTELYHPYILDNSLFVGTKNAQKMYFIFFADIDGHQYYSQNQFKMWFDVSEVFDDDGNFTNYYKTLSLKYWDVMESSEADSTTLFTTSYDFSDYKFMHLILSPSSTYFSRAYPTFSGYLNEKQPYFNTSCNLSKYDTLYAPDFTSSFDYLSLLYNSNHGFEGNYANHSASCIYDDKCDIGLLVSSTPIDFTYRDIDTTKIPSGQIVTINGDTIYNYNITNPDTGESNTINEYVTNNYTYITNNNGGESAGSGGSGGVGGNVTVGGEIEVGGSVGVDINVSVPDININVNGNGGAGGSSSLPDTDLVENLPEAPSGFIDYTASLFSFLPAEILSLLIAGLAAAIFCRIWGR